MRKFYIVKGECLNLREEYREEKNQDGKEEYEKEK